MPALKYKVELNESERTQLKEIASRGETSARKVKRALVLLKADEGLTADAEDGTFMWGGQPTFMPGGTYPLAWTRNYGNGKIFKTTLGHNGLSFRTPQFQRLILNGVNWVKRES